MKKLFLATAGLLGLLAARPATAQYFVLPFLNANQNPGSLNGDAEYPASTGGGLPAGWTILFNGTAATFTAPVWSPVATVPFAFQFNGLPVSGFKVATSGVLTFTTTTTAVPSAANTTLPSASLPDKSVAVWGLAANAGDFIITKTFGTAPNRQHWIQFNSYSKPASTTIFTYWSIVLEETTNKIYVVDQRTNVSTGLNLTVGVQVDATTAVSVAASPSVNSLTQSGPTPADNTYYTFTYGSQPPYDMALTSLSLPAIVSRGAAVSVSGALQNLGTQAVTSYNLSYKVDNQATVIAAVNGASLASQVSRPFAHPTAWSPSTVGQYRVKAWVSAPNGMADPNPGNDTLRAMVRVLEDSLRRFVVEECFTSATCPPCTPGNIVVENVNKANAGKHVVIKFQQNFPAPGNDPYYTAECGARRAYYGINAIPYMTLDGGWNQNSNSFTTAVLDQFYVVPVTMRIKGTYTLQTNLVSATSSIRPFQAYSAGQLVAHMVITERRTVRNVRTNGEREFYQVMKKMLPNASGTPLPALAAGQAYNLTQSFDVSTLPTAQSVENFDSLRVVVFVQNVATKQIYQGAYLTLLRPSGVRETQRGTAFAIVPNPSEGSTKLLFTLDRPEKVRVEVLDVLGRHVLDRPQVALSSGSQEMPLMLRNQAAGLYTVRLTTSAGVRTSKLTLE